MRISVRVLDRYVHGVEWARLQLLGWALFGGSDRSPTGLGALVTPEHCAGMALGTEVGTTCAEVFRSYERCFHGRSELRAAETFDAAERSRADQLVLDLADAVDPCCTDTSEAMSSTGLPTAAQAGCA